MIIHIVGARPNFIKAAPIIKAIEYIGLEQKILHTGQHYSFDMSEVIFKNLSMQEPDLNLNIFSGSFGQRFGNLVKDIENYIQIASYSCVGHPMIVVVYGDVDSTLAGALVVSRMPNVTLVHVESGLRSFDFTMPEEANRVFVDGVSDVLFCTEKNGCDNLKREGVNGEYFLVGNTMIDSLMKIDKQLNRKLDFDYLVATFHRPSNVDSVDSLGKIMKFLDKFKDINVIFPMHPRTKKMMEKFDLIKDIKKMKFITICSPMSYIDFVALVKYSKGVLTDSGGIQEETTFLGIPCLTFRDNTERPSTLHPSGTNILTNVMDYWNFEKLQTLRKHCDIPLWDGKASNRIVEVLKNYA